MKQILFCMSILMATLNATAQDSFTCRAQRYIAQYSCYAISEQQRCGVPASVTLAQGVLETEAGRSELVSLANNHFGIKCKNDYNGPKVYHDDDRPKECFKMYRSAEDSYKDHSDYLKRNKRYEPLFTYTATDYKSWAKGLKRCGYATNPIYADRLIKIIEDFNLQDYTLKAINSPAVAAMEPAPKDTLITARPVSPARQVPTKVVIPTQPMVFAGALPNDTTKKVAMQQQPEAVAAEAKNTADTTRKAATTEVKPAVAPVTDTAPTTTTVAVPQHAAATDVKFDSGKVIVVNGLKAFYANKGEMLLQYAVKYNLKYQRILEINDLTDAPLTDNTLVYLEKKHNEGTHAKHTVKEGETLFMIAQQEGIVLKRLMALNMLEPGDEPAIGTILELQNGATRTPGLRALPATDLNNSHNLSFVAPTPADGYVAITHPTHADTVAAQAIKKEVNRDTYVTTIHTTSDSVMKMETVPVKPAIPDPVKKTEPSLIAADSTAKHGDTTADELDALKAKLDKVVYPVKVDKPVKSQPIVLSPISDEPERKPKKGAKEPLAAKGPKAPKGGGSYYTVKHGDNLSNIAKSQHTTITDILAINDIDPDDLHLGQKLRMPGYGRDEEPETKPAHASRPAAEPKAPAKAASKLYTVKKGDNLSNIAKSQHTTVKEILRLNDIDADDLHLGQKLRLK